MCLYRYPKPRNRAEKINDWNDCNDCLICNGPPMTGEKNKSRQFSEWVLPVFASFISFFSAFRRDRVNVFDDRRVIESTINKKCHTNWDKGSNYDHANIINSLVNTNLVAGVFSPVWCKERNDSLLYHEKKKNLLIFWCQFSSQISRCYSRQLFCWYSTDRHRKKLTYITVTTI